MTGISCNLYFEKLVESFDNVKNKHTTENPNSSTQTGSSRITENLQTAMKATCRFAPNPLQQYFVTAICSRELEALCWCAWWPTRREKNIIPIHTVRSRAGERSLRLHFGTSHWRVCEHLHIRSIWASRSSVLCCHSRAPVRPWHTTGDGTSHTIECPHMSVCALSPSVRTEITANVLFEAYAYIVHSYVFEHVFVWSGKHGYVTCERYDQYFQCLLGTLSTAKIKYTRTHALKHS